MANAVGLRRDDAELEHAARPFVTERELDAEWDAKLARMDDRAAERILRRGRSARREL